MFKISVKVSLTRVPNGRVRAINSKVIPDEDTINETIETIRVVKNTNTSKSNVLPSFKNSPPSKFILYSWKRRD